MKHFLNKIFATTLALLVLMSTFSFTVEKHYCGDFLIDVAYLGKADGCGVSTTDSCGTQIKKKKCCKNEIHQIDGQDEIQKQSIEDVSFQKITLFTTFYSAYQFVFQDLEKQFLVHKYYSPPDLVKDVQVLHEVFII